MVFNFLKKLTLLESIEFIHHGLEFRKQQEVRKIKKKKKKKEEEP